MPHAPQEDYFDHCLARLVPCHAPNALVSKNILREKVAKVRKKTRNHDGTMFGLCTCLPRKLARNLPNGSILKTIIPNFILPVSNKNHISQPLAMNQKNKKWQSSQIGSPSTRNLANRWAKSSQPSSHNWIWKKLRNSSHRKLLALTTYKSLPTSLPN